MHCRACDQLLTSFEATRRNANTFEFMDLCKTCYNEVKHIVPVIERKDLATSEDFDDDLDSEGTIEYYEDIKDFISNTDFNE